jgi:hypothetical protein
LTAVNVKRMAILYFLPLACGENEIELRAPVMEATFFHGAADDD